MSNHDIYIPVPTMRGVLAHGQASCFLFREQICNPRPASEQGIVRRLWCIQILIHAKEIFHKQKRSSTSMAERSCKYSTCHHDWSISSVQLASIPFALLSVTGWMRAIISSFVMR